MRARRRESIAIDRKCPPDSCPCFLTCEKLWEVRQVPCPRGNSERPNSYQNLRWLSVIRLNPQCALVHTQFADAGEPLNSLFAALQRTKKIHLRTLFRC